MNQIKSKKKPSVLFFVAVIASLAIYNLYYQHFDHDLDRLFGNVGRALSAKDGEGGMVKRTGKRKQPHLQLQPQPRPQHDHHQRPVMHTFFEPVSGGCCGMSEEGHLDLLRAWEESWQDAGWDTKILTTQDASRHTYTKEFRDLLRRKGIDVNPYNRRCFLRWFAMAATEGGWMSDYDTFPLRMDASSSSEEDYNILPNGGTFTAHERAVPSLVSASQSEWERVSRLLLDTIPTHDGLVTDMYMLESIRLSNIKNGNNNNNHDDDEDAGISFVPMRKEVQQGFPYKRIFNDGVGKRRRIVNCEVVKQTKAMHFSHDSTAKAVGKGTFPLEGISKVNPAVERRGRAALEFLRDWKEQCWKKEMQQHRQRLGGGDGLLLTKE